MKKAFMFRHLIGNDTLRSTLVIDGVKFSMLENPWKDNERNISCIPAGTYRVDYLEKSYSGRYEKVYWVRDVKDRDQILIHCGNVVSHTQGCLIIGLYFGELKGKDAVLSSRNALDAFRKIVGEESFELEIIEPTYD